MQNLRKELTVERLCELLHYDPVTGVFTRKVTLNSRFKVGDIVGVQRPDGYLRMSVDDINYFAHRLAWLHVYGVWADEQIDHINRVRSDNRIENLREATRSENAQNIAMFSTNTSGFKGVSYDSSRGKWAAKIGILGLGKQKTLGRFPSAEEAAKAYAKAAAQYHTRNPAALCGSNV